MAKTAKRSKHERCASMVPLRSCSRHSLLDLRSGQTVFPLLWPPRHTVSTDILILSGTKSMWTHLVLLFSATNAYLLYLTMFSPCSIAYLTFCSFLYKDVASNRNKETANFFAGHA